MNKENDPVVLETDSGYMILSTQNKKNGKFEVPYNKRPSK